MFPKGKTLKASILICLLIFSFEFCHKKDTPAPTPLPTQVPFSSMVPGSWVITDLDSGGVEIFTQDYRHDVFSFTSDGKYSSNTFDNGTWVIKDSTFSIVSVSDSSYLSDDWNIASLDSNVIVLEDNNWNLRFTKSNKVSYQ